jgi:hypothetical protein
MRLGIIVCSLVHLSFRNIYFIDIAENTHIANSQQREDDYQDLQAGGLEIRILILLRKLTKGENYV